ncbi:MAG: hypothetical protein ACJAT4_000951 [Granulosicoccus sp.]|jgi:hypothetical protein
MKIENIILGILILLLLGCGEKAETENLEFEKVIESLNSNDDKRGFLEKVYEEDQKVRDGSKDAELMLKYGKDSKEHMEYIQAQWKQDEINLNKVEKYIEKFGYPKKKELGKDAAIAPWIVIHHSTDTAIRNRNFEILYKAYLAEDIDDTAMSLYLGRTYEFTFRERFRMENPYRSEDEINQLIKKLGLEKRKANVQKSIQR